MYQCLRSVIIISFIVKLTFVSFSHLHMSVKSGIIIRQMLKILKKQYLILIGTGPLKIFLWMKVELFNETLNIFPNYNPNKNIKCDYRQPPRMTDNIKKSLKQRSKLTKIFYKNGQKNSDYIKVLEKSEECTSLIAEAKKNNILKMTYNLEDSNTASETYCPILNRFHYNKNTLQYHLYLLMVISFQIFARKSTFLISFFLLYAHL